MIVFMNTYEYIWNTKHATWQHITACMFLEAGLRALATAGWEISQLGTIGEIENPRGWAAEPAKRTYTLPGSP